MSALHTLQDGIEAYSSHLARRPISENTRKAFVGDARIFSRWLGEDRKMSVVTSDHIRGFLEQQERGGTARSPKSLERRLTSLKVFFDWAARNGMMRLNPADGVAYRPFLDPLPEYLTQEQAAAALNAAHVVAHGDKLEMRPLLAITLVLETGIKKGECLQLHSADVEGGNTPTLVIRYPKRHLQYKDRRLALSKDALKILEQYIARYEIKGRLLDCTGRNLEYMFNRRIAPRAGLASLTFEQMRWTCALRDWHNRQDSGMTDAQLQIKYGLSAAAWAEMVSKLQRLDPQFTSTSS